MNAEELHQKIAMMAGDAHEAGMGVNELLGRVRAGFVDAQQAVDAKADWDLICAHMSYNGKQFDSLSQAQKDLVWVVADGFGRVGIETIVEQCYDWSHIRDSSSEAVEFMAAAIRRLMCANVSG